MKNVLYVIGNGFDLKHKLPTSFKNYKEFLINLDAEMVNLIDSEILKIEGNDVSNWSNLERDLGIINYLDNKEEIYDDAFANSETDIERASYWGDPKYNADEYTDKRIKIYNFIKNNFTAWISSINDANKKIKIKKFRRCFINFNYTLTLENTYKIPTEQILHLHGCVNNNLILGHNNTKELPYENVYDYEYDEVTGCENFIDDVRQIEVRKSINNLYLTIYNTYYKNSKQIIIDNETWFKKFYNAKKIIFMGFSFGVEDIIYINEIINKIPKSCIIVYYFYSKDNKDKLIKIHNQYFHCHKSKFKKW